MAVCFAFNLSPPPMSFSPIPNVPVFLIQLASELGRRSSEERVGSRGSEFMGLWLRMQESFDTVWARFGDASWCLGWGGVGGCGG